MSTPKFIREGRMGPPLTYKTGAVVNTYPRPLLVLEFDVGGLDVVKDKIEYIAPIAIGDYAKKKTEELPPLCAVDFSNVAKPMFDLSIKSFDNTVAMTFLDVVNKIIRIGCPWKTVVVDQLGGLSDAFIGHIGVTDSASMNDARQWAHKAGVLIQRAIMVIQGLPCNTVFLMHVETEKNEVTGEINTDPMIPSKLRQRLASMFSQFFYAAIEAGKPVVYAQPTGFVKSVGMRKPEQSPAKMGATYQEIYGNQP